MGQKDKYGEWDWEVVSSFSKGLDKSVDGDLIPKEALTKATNVIYKKGQLRNAPGYSQYFNVNIGTSLGFTPMFQFDREECYLVTTTTIFVMGMNSIRWPVKLAGGWSTTLSANALAGDTSVQVTSAAGMAIGNIIRIGGADYGVISGIAGTTITFAGYPLTVNRNSGVAVTQGISITATSYISPTYDPYTNTTLFTTGNGNVYAVDNTADTASLITLTGITTPRLFAFWNSSLWVVEGNNTLWRSAIGDYTDFTIAVGATSGNAELSETPGSIVAIIPFGDFLFVFKNFSIIRVEFVGTQEKYYDYTVLRDDIGVVSRAAVVSVGEGLVFMGFDNVYFFDGGQSFNAIGDSLFLPLFDDPTAIKDKNNVRLAYISAYKQVWIMFSSSTSAETNVDECYVLDTATGAFTVRSTRKSSNTYLVDVIERRDDDSGSASSLFFRTSDTYLYKIDENIHTDDGVATAWEINTKVFSDPPYDMRLDGVSCLLWSNDGDIVCRDRDSTSLVDMATRDFTNDKIQRRRFDGQTVSDNLMFQIAGTGKMRLGWFAIRASRESGE